MDKYRVECFDIGKEAHSRIEGASSRSMVDVDWIIKNAIERRREKEYSSSRGKPERIKGLGKGVEYVTQ